VEWPFYEAVLDTLRAELCYDEQRVFASGNSSGAWLANELGCKYAGNSDGYAIRGIAVNTGGLPTDPTRVPTCSQAPMAGFGIWEDDCCQTGSSTGNKVAIARAMQVNGCTVGTNYDNASLEDYPIGGDNPDDLRQKIQGCPDDYPLVICALPGSGHGSHDNVANPGFATFIKSLAAP
jgi:poly(3-hydroxybutyrate) depolymerase